VELLRHGHGLLLDSYVFPGEDQFPVSGDRIGHGSDGLLGEGPVRDFAVVLGDTDVSRVDGTPESVEQLLLEPDEYRRLHGRVAPRYPCCFPAPTPLLLACSTPAFRHG